ncbi:MAG: protein kinase domain-containing protein, partial [Polyangiaceae bacterium]
MTSISHRFLGLDPEDVGGSAAKGSFAKALAERCFDGDRIDALIDVILASRSTVDPRIRDFSRLNPASGEEISGGDTFEHFLVLRKLGESELAIAYSARRDGEDCILKVLRAEAARDKRAVHRFLTANRMVSDVLHPGLPTGLDAGESEGRYWVSYAASEGQTLSSWFARTGASRYDDLQPILLGILDPLSALHEARIAHGDLKLENVLIAETVDKPRVTLIDFGTDRLRQRVTATNGHTGLLAVFGSPKTIAPEQVRGRRADAATDVYGFGAMMYELLSGKPVFAVELATEAAFAHVMENPRPPSSKAPPGWIPPEVDRLVLNLLSKDPSKRPADASAVIEAIRTLDRRSVAVRVDVDFSDDKLGTLIDLLIAAPDDTDTALALEKAVEEGADPVNVAEAFQVAEVGVSGDDADAQELKKSLIYRAARMFAAAGDNEKAEAAYDAVLEIDPDDEIAQMAIDDMRKALGKHAEVVESLLSRSEAAAPGPGRARILAEIGRLLARELDDPEQAVLAYARALCDAPADKKVASEIERLAEGKTAVWNEVLSAVHAGIQSEETSSVDKVHLLTYAGRWYEQKLSRADLALYAYQQMVTTDPASEAGYEGIAAVYRKVQQWPELANTLVGYADIARSAPHARELRAEAGEILEQKLSDPHRAHEIYSRVLSEDPGHAKASEGLARLAENRGDFKELVGILQKRAEVLKGRDEIDALMRVAEVYEDRLEDLTEGARRFEMVLALDPQNVDALKGLDRIFNRTGKYRELADNLERQLAVAATPRQKINIYELMATLHDEEFLDHAKAAECLEEILGLEGTNDSALTMLPRHYRALSRWDALAEIYETHAEATTDDVRRVDLLMNLGKVLAEHVGSPERAVRAFERALAVEPGHAAALEALAGLREQAGDLRAAVTAIEALAEAAEKPEERGEHWLRAARLLETHGDRDGAIERYKLAVEANPKDGDASAALREAYALRGDAASVVTLIEKELEHAEGKVAQAQLHAELARVQHERLHQDEDAEANARVALELDPTNADGLLVVGDLAFERGRFVEATKHLEGLVSRASGLPREDAVRAIVRFVEAYGSTVAPTSSPGSAKERDSGPAVGESNPRLSSALQALEEVAPGDAEALARVARVVFDSGDARGALQAYQRLIDRAGGDMTHI